MPDAVLQPADLEAVRSSYDRVADNYVASGMGDLDPHPWLRAALAAFAEEVRPLGPVLDVGCGPGSVTAHLAGLGLDVSGVDLSPRMVEHARSRHPGLEFAVASATDLDLADGSLGGVLGWWSLFNLPRTCCQESSRPSPGPSSPAAGCSSAPTPATARCGARRRTAVSR